MCCNDAKRRSCLTTKALPLSVQASTPLDLDAAVDAAINNAAEYDEQVSDDMRSTCLKVREFS
jgi:hypothetical protein